MNALFKAPSFHGYLDTHYAEVDDRLVNYRYTVIQEREVSYRFFSHFHPYTDALTRRLIYRGVDGLQEADTDYRRKPDGSLDTLPDGRAKPVLYAEFFAAYRPEPAQVETPHPVKDLDFTYSGAYAVYNWELFFHVPFTVAVHLSKNQRYAEAQQWFHFLFDPTDDSDGPTPERFWKVRPFQYTDVRKLEDMLVNLATGEDAELRDDMVRSIEAWKDAPFRPHVIARYRQQAYMYKTVMAYLDNLIAWGDSLFRQDTGEAIDEAFMLYVLAMNILGPRPGVVPKKGGVRPQTYANLRQDLSQFGTVMRDLESELVFNLMPHPTHDTDSGDRFATVRSLGKALYFCVPRNDKLLGYWDVVADRLFKIRNSLNIQGVFRRLALFEPPIDPAMLARAAAAGLDVGAIVNGLNQPLPLVRFQWLSQKATELAQEVKSLGAQMLAAMEKEEGEMLAALRARHERVMLEMVEQVRYAQWQESIKSREGLLQSLAIAVQRYTYYERQLGRSAEEIQQTIPALDALDRAALEKMKLSASEPVVEARDIEIDIAQNLGAAGGRIISSHEAEELEKSQQARDLQNAVNALNLAAMGLALIPDFEVDLSYWGLGTDIVVAGGEKLAQVARFAASLASAASDHASYQAGQAAKIASYARREQDWAFQSSLAAGEITQIYKQLRAAEIREAVSELELKNHRQQIRHARDVEDFLNEEGTQKKGKKTNRALYAWMKREVKGLYGQYFQLAFDTARKAERALAHELGRSDLSYVQFGYLAGREGLFAGEKLMLDIKRMELAYAELNQREYELTKHASLLQTDPNALIELRATGRCTLVLPESLFDLDGPGHYFRRIRSVAITIPCITGPYASVNCRLTLQKSSIRKTSVVGDDGYARVDSEDARFDDYYGSVESSVASSAQNDQGLFEAGADDARYLPFEHAGAVSEWRLELPGNPANDDPCVFDYNSISDVILHLRYTAREGGNILRDAAMAHVREQLQDARIVGSTRLFSVRHEFASAWAKLVNGAPAANERHALTLSLRPEHYPFWSKGRLNSVNQVAVIARSSLDAVPATLVVADRPDRNDVNSKTDDLNKDRVLGDLLKNTLSNVSPLAAPVGDLSLYFDSNALADLWIAVTWNE